MAGHTNGFTLVELITAIVLMAIAFVSLSITMSYSAGRSADGMWQVKTVELSDAYFDEILAMRFDENSAQGGVPACSISTTACSVGAAFDDGETRAEFDDVDDYDGLDETPPRDVNDGVRAGYAGYRVEIDVTYPTAAQVTAYGLDDTTDAKVIIARIHPPGRDPVTFSAYRGNF